MLGSIRLPGRPICRSTSSATERNENCGGSFRRIAYPQGRPLQQDVVTKGFQTATAHPQGWAVVFSGAAAQ